jgi:hypothetical protein
VSPPRQGRGRVREVAWACALLNGSLAHDDKGFDDYYFIYRTRKEALDERAEGERVVRVTITEAPARRATAKGRRKGKR